MAKTKKVTPKHILAAIVCILGIFALIAAVVMARGTTFMGTKADNTCDACISNCGRVFAANSKQKAMPEQLATCTQNCQKKYSCAKPIIKPSPSPQTGGGGRGGNIKVSPIKPTATPGATKKPGYGSIPVPTVKPL